MSVQEYLKMVVIEIKSDLEFQEKIKLKQYKYTIIDFQATWCPSCNIVFGFFYIIIQLGLVMALAAERFWMFRDRSTNVPMNKKPFMIDPENGAVTSPGFNFTT